LTIRRSRYDSIAEKPRTQATALPLFLSAEVADDSATSPPHRTAKSAPHRTGCWKTCLVRDNHLIGAGYVPRGSSHFDIITRWTSYEQTRKVR
jgi:hypothetical protein